MNRKELNKLSIEELVKLNGIVVDIIKNKRRNEAAEVKDELYVGQAVRVNHKKLRGEVLEIIKINRIKVVVRSIKNRVDFNVPANLIEAI